MAKFTMYKDTAGEYRWRLRANNNKTTADSGEGYSTRTGCRDAIVRVKKEISDADIEDDT